MADKTNERIITRWQKDYKKGFTSYLILLLLKNSEMYGYEIKQKLETMTDDRITYTESGIYQILKKLRAEKMIAIKTITSVNGPPRKYYAITERGKSITDVFTREYAMPIYAALSSLLDTDYQNGKTERH